MSGMNFLHAQSLPALQQKSEGLLGKKIFFESGIPTTTIPNVFNKSSMDSRGTTSVDSLTAFIFKKALDSVHTANSVVKGVSAAVMLKNGSIWQSASGVSTDVGGTTIPLDTTHYFGMGSITKSFTAVSILKLMEQGKLSLQDTIGKWIKNQPNIPGSVTIKQILNHTSGIANYSENPDFFQVVFIDLEHVWSPDEIYSFVTTPLFPPGTGWSYCNTNYIIAGDIVEQVSGKPYHEFVRENILIPGGLEDIVCYPQESLQGEFAHLWADLDQNGSTEDLFNVNFPLTGLFSTGWSAGALVSRPALITRWIAALRDGKVLGQAARDSITTEMVQLSANSWYGLGFVVFNFLVGPNLHTLIGHDGDIVYTSLLWYDVTKETAFAVQCHDEKGGEINITTSVFLALLERCLQMTTGTPPVLENQTIQIYPQPASNFCNIKYSGIEIPPLRIMDALGQEVTVKYQTLQGNEIQLDVEHLHSGVYFLQSQYAGSVYTQPFLIQK